jgi:CAAX protease family protein
VLASTLASPPTGDWRYGMDWTIIAVGFLGAAVAANPVRRLLARVIPIEADNPVHALALTLAVVLFGGGLALVVFTDQLRAELNQPPLSAADIFWTELPLLLLGVAGVGVFMRRDLPAAARRLGVVRPAWWQPVLAVAAAGVFVAVADVLVNLSYQLTPELAHRVDASSQHLFGALSQDPVGLLLLAVVPGVCEDALFRGALQPRLGLIATAALFASTHTEYGLSVVLLAVFVLAIGLGLIRKYTNTTTSMTCHVTYNLLAGISIAGTWLFVAIGVEVLLLAVAGYAIWTTARRRTHSAPAS